MNLSSQNSTFIVCEDISDFFPDLLSSAASKQSKSQLDPLFHTQSLARKMGCCGSKEKSAQSGANGYPTTTVSGQNQAHQPGPAVQTQKVPAQMPQPRPQQQPASKPTPVSSQKTENTILGKPFEDIKQHYTLGKELGRGQFGITYLCTEKSTGHTYACKSILKRKLVSKSDRDDVKREIQIMQHLSSQPNIVEFRGAYEDRYSVHVVMELCAGGELFDRIIAKGHYTERAAASICRAIVNVVNICHFMGVMHRDLKPENFLLASKDEGAMLKATDFGLSVFIEEGGLLFLFKILFFLCKK